MTEMSSNVNQVERLALAIDVGGTNIKAAVINSHGEPLSVKRVGTPAKSAPDQVIHEILEIMHGLCLECSLDSNQLEGIGVSFAGFVTADGTVTATAHLSRDFIGLNLHSLLSPHLPSRYYFSLDTPTPTLGEAYFGAGRGFTNFAYVTVSTGIGAGIMINGRYFTGGMGWAGGVGHIIIDESSERVCEGCGNHGCLETFAAKQGIVTTAREMSEQFPASCILQLAGGKVESITPKLVYEAAQAGDQTARRVFDHAGHALGLGLVCLADIVAPELIIIGGGIAQAGDILLEPARKVVRERAFPPRIRGVEIVQAALGDMSAVFGAAAMVFFDLRINSPVD
jgi:glucokinase